MLFASGHIITYVPGIIIFPHHTTSTRWLSQGWSDPNLCPKFVSLLLLMAPLPLLTLVPNKMKACQTDSRQQNPWIKPLLESSLLSTFNNLPLVIGKFPFKGFIHEILPRDCQPLQDSLAWWIKTRERFPIATCWRNFSCSLKCQSLRWWIWNYTELSLHCLINRKK